jgi:hypothetical protein
MTRTDHRYAGTRKHFDTSAHEQHDRRIIDFLQACRVCGIVESNNFCAALDGLRDFLLRKFH